MRHCSGQRIDSAQIAIAQIAPKRQNQIPVVVEESDSDAVAIGSQHLGRHADAS